MFYTSNLKCELKLYSDGLIKSSLEKINCEDYIPLIYFIIIILLVMLQYYLIKKLT